MDRITLLEVIKMIDSQLAYYARVTGENISYVESKEIGLVSLRNDLKEYIKQQDKPGCDYCKSIGRDCYCCAADE